MTESKQSQVMVNNLKLPVLLVELMDAGRWKQPADVSVLAEMIGDSWTEGFSFDRLDTIIQETNANFKLRSQGLGEIYGLTSSSDANVPYNPAFLDVDRAVVIAGNYREEIIALDYSENLNEPRVVCGPFSQADKILYWVVIASTFEEFASRLAL